MSLPELLQAVALIGPDLPGLVTAGVTFALWLRFEHRMTRVETKLDNLPCPKATPCKSNE